MHAPRRPRHSSAHRTPPGHSLWLWAPLALLLSFTGVTSATRAQSGDAAGTAEPTGYREAVAAALEEFQAQNYEEARSLFLRAHALFPNARTHRALGLVEFELRNYIESVPHLEEALRSTTRPLSDSLRSEAQQTLVRAYGFVARVQLELMPADGRLLIDGTSVQAGQAQLLAIGEHKLRAEAAGFEPETRIVGIKGGEQLSVRFSLKPVPPPDTSRGPNQAHTDATPRRWYKSPWLWIGVGVVVAGAAAGTAVVLTRDDEPTTFGGSTSTVLPGP